MYCFRPLFSPKTTGKIKKLECQEQYYIISKLENSFHSAILYGLVPITLQSSEAALKRGGVQSTHSNNQRSI